MGEEEFRSFVKGKGLKTRPLSETEFQKQVVELATILGWQWVHFRPAQTSKGWRTPVSGTLGKGWPDLVLVREKDQRLLFVELKQDNAKLSPEQAGVLNVLKWVGEVAVWRPRDFEAVAALLR